MYIWLFFSLYLFFFSHKILKLYSVQRNHTFFHQHEEEEREKENRSGKR